jgi:deoxycytidylate deaminase
MTAMTRHDSLLEPYTDSELVLGLVAPVGADLGAFQAMLCEALSHYRYNCNPVRISEIALRLTGRVVPERVSYFDRLGLLMDAGNAAREKSLYALALAAASSINAKRTPTGVATAPLPRSVHIVRSIKNPQEVLALRRIYGSGFFLLGVVTTEQQRTEHLAKRRGCSEEEIARLRERDDHEILEHGQRTRDTFHLADAFLPLDEPQHLHRFLDLVFGAPHITPQPDEHAMFMAFSAALRSGDLSRQVGAILVSEGGEIIATGANDVPTPGGGLCWPGPKDQRDFVLGKDFNEVERNEMIDDVIERLRPEGQASEQWLADGREKLASATIVDITEYGRPVHAEMEALLAAGRSGVSARGATLYCTTFPCHNCAKHLIAAGVRRVVYVEPYPKSRTGKLYERSVRFQGAAADEDERVLFEPFQGIGPRRFFDLFSLKLGSGYPVKRKDRGGNARADWTPATSEARVPLLPTSYLVREAWASQEIIRLFSPSEGDSHNGSRGQES